MSIPPSEQIVLKSLLDFREDNHIRPLTAEESDGFLRLLDAEMQAEQAGELKPFDRVNLENNRHTELIKQMSSGFGFKVFAGRQHPQTQMSFELFLFLLTTCKSPGDAVLWAYTLFRMHQKEQKTLTLGDWANDFPTGLPNEEARHLCWRAQKGETHGLTTDNLIDQGEYWK